MNRRSLLARLAAAPAAIMAGLALAREALATPRVVDYGSKVLTSRTPVIVRRRVPYVEWQSWPRRDDWAIEERDLTAQIVTVYWVGPNSDLAERRVVTTGATITPHADGPATATFDERVVNVLHEDVNFGHPDASDALAGRLWRA